MLYNDLISYATNGASQDCSVLKGKTYREIKNCNKQYKKNKNEFFKTLAVNNLGRYPKVNDEVDNFVLDFEPQLAETLASS